MVAQHSHSPRSAAVPSRAAAWLLAAALGAGAAGSQAEPGSAQALLARHAELADELARNPYGEPLFIASSEEGDSVGGDIYAVMDHPFAQAGSALRPPASWCHILLLHVNTKQCTVEQGAGGPLLAVRIGMKHEQPLEQTQRMAFAYRVEAARKDYLQVRFDAPSGPLGTRDYSVNFEAVPIAGNRTFVHLRYGWSSGLAARLAMRTYLATGGSGKVGFSQAGTGADGRPRLVGGMRGVVERNTMRYYLAIDAFLASLRLPPAQQLQYRLDAWFDGTERYARQLRETDRASYLSLKRAEHERQQTAS